MKSSLIVGHFDELRDGYATGWVTDEKNTARRLTIEIVCGRYVVGRGCGDIFREDLLAAQIGDGKYGFRIPVALDVGVRKRPLYAREATTKKRLIGKHRVPDGFIGAGSLDTLSNKTYSTSTIHSRIKRKIKRVLGRASTLHGSIDTVIDGQVHGWAFDSKRPSHPLEVEILSGEMVVARGLANGFREDLLANGYGDGHHLFCLPLASAIYDGTSHQLRIREAGATTLIDCAPFLFRPTGEHAEQLIKQADKESAIPFLLQCLEENPESEVVAAKLDQLLGGQSLEMQRGLPGMEEVIQCQRAQRLLSYMLEQQGNLIPAREHSPLRREEGIALLTAEWETQRAELEKQNGSLKQQLVQVTTAHDEQTLLKKQHQEEISVLTKQRESLFALQKQLILERDEQARLANERLKERETLTKEQESLLAYQKQLILERDEQARLANERLKEREILTKEQESLLAYQKQLILERDEQARLANERKTTLEAVQGELSALESQFKKKEARIAQLEAQETETGYRQRLLQEELIKAEAQIELIKDVLLREQSI